MTTYYPNIFVAQILFFVEDVTKIHISVIVISAKVRLKYLNKVFGFVSSYIAKVTSYFWFYQENKSKLFVTYFFENDKNVSVNNYSISIIGF